ncbi:type 2 DNA topoisomerase 6 subunit B-like isoform X1 [Anarrhichthys ocellatus]|uniref:type 2 DNA topoisomerase 6 subunit B-like isoform X1 n=1 Tax=Anarrhichthys ocellatus TaxID=433405 RepID=UPI0012EED62D|nr:type 2 DNA topoisomerase 6 subunit B-like isoform X1 [Anarrhichthys ocellatus]
MIREIQQALRLIMLLEKQRRHPGLNNARGLLVLLWTDTGASMNCTVAAAGPWCTGIEMKALQPALTDLKESMFACTWSCPQPDPEELCAFTDTYGSLRLLLSFQMKEARLLIPEWCARIEVFLHSFSSANARIKIHFKFKFSQQSVQRDFRVNIVRKVACANRPSLILDVTCKTQPPECMKKGCWCHGGHPVLGGRLPLSIPPEAMDHGLFGELSVQPVTLLSPCVLQYPNLAIQLTDIQVLVCGPSNVPFTGPSTLLQNLPAHLDCQELGLHGLHCSSSKDPVHRGGTVYTVEQENCEDPEQESGLPPMQQSLLLYLFLQHSDPFTYQLSDMMATEVLIEHHLEDILNNNRQAVTTALQTELRNALKPQNHRKKDQEKLRSAAEVILSSAVSIVSCSSNMDFRNACLNRMKVHDTHELSASLCESLRRVTSWKFTPRSGCYSAQMEEHPDSDEPTRTEI